MALDAGTTIGVYEVVGLIGQGGMGEVYQARDTKLDRDVALKVLPEAFTSDPDRLARFEREAKTLASLNHPNIGSIYGLEEAEGIKALVLELVEGPTLADRIKQGPIPIDEALPIAKQIAEALADASPARSRDGGRRPAPARLAPPQRAESAQRAAVVVASEAWTAVPDDRKGTRPGTVATTPASTVFRVFV